MIPGSTAMGSLASVAAASGAQGGGLAAPVIQLAQALQARPPTYEVRVFTERCQAGGQVAGDGPRRRVTVEVRDARTGRSVAVQVLQPCVPQETAARVAGYTARQIFRHDPATPAWPSPAGRRRWGGRLRARGTVRPRRRQSEGPPGPPEQPAALPAVLAGPVPAGCFAEHADRQAHRRRVGGPAGPGRPLGHARPGPHPGGDAPPPDRGGGRGPGKGRSRPTQTA